MNKNARFVVYKASAGSGKTYTLVREYLRLAFDVPEAEWPRQFRRILAITFTNKAANEMKERVLSYLDGMIQRGTDTAMGAELAKTLGWDSRRLQQAAQTVHTAILHNYSDFAVSTIDRFMSRIIHTFARDLNLPVGFDVVTDEQQLVQVSVDALLDQAGLSEEQDLSAILCDYLLSRLDEGKTGLFSTKEREIRGSIDSSIKALAKDIFKEEVPEYLRQLAGLNMNDFRELRNRYLAENKQLEQRVAAEGKGVLQLFEERGLTADMFYYKKKGVYGYFARCGEGELVEPNTYVEAFFSSDKHVAKECPAAAAEAIESLLPQMEAAYKRITAMLKTEMPVYNTRKELCKHLYQLALLNRIAQLVEQQYGEEEVIHISEFNKRISEVVQNEPMPFVYERIGSRYQYYLIDEFQDTSKMQWQNLLPLVENSVAQGGYVMVVGDAKQAIYRFRQGDVEQFVSLPQVDSKMHGQLLRRPELHDVRSLDVNYRSREVVVQFNNEFYSWLGNRYVQDNPLLHRIFVGEGEKPDLWQETKRTGGYVSLDFWPMGRKDNVPVETMWQRVYDIIRQQVDEKGYRYRDITVLARKGRHLNAVADYLSTAADGRQPVPMVSVESFLLRNSTAVQLLRAALLWIEDEYNSLAALQVLECLRRLDLLRVDYASAVIDRGLAHLSEILAAEGFELSRTALADMPIYECCEALVRLFRLQDTETDYVVSFLGRVHEYTCRHRNHIGEFVEWFDSKDLSLSTSDVVDAVKLSTIHKAKGLEAPVVIVVLPPVSLRTSSMWVSLQPYEAQLSLPVSPVTKTSGDTQVLYREEMQEEVLRSQIDDADVLYVATTRPREKLFVLGGLNAGEEPYSQWLHDYVAEKQSTEQVSVKEQKWEQVSLELGERYVCGEDSAPERRDDGEASLPVENVRPRLRFAPWEEKVVVASLPEAAATVLHDDARQFGLAMHEVLSHLMDDGDADRMVDDYCAWHQAPEEWRDRLKEQIHRLLAQPESACFFDSRYRVDNECELMYRGQVLRPDRIVYTPEAVKIVDFKTGEAERGHAEQVSTYRDALRAMGHERVRAYLLYTQTASVVEV